MDNCKNIKRIDFIEGMANSDGEFIDGTGIEMSVLFNETVISAEKVQELIKTGMHEHDVRVICVLKIQADYLKGK